MVGTAAGTLGLSAGTEGASIVRWAIAKYKAHTALPNSVKATLDRMAESESRKIDKGCRNKVADTLVKYLSVQPGFADEVRQLARPTTLEKNRHTNDSSTVPEVSRAASAQAPRRGVAAVRISIKQLTRAERRWIQSNRVPPWHVMLAESVRNVMRMNLDDETDATHCWREHLGDAATEPRRRRAWATEFSMVLEWQFRQSAQLAPLVATLDTLRQDLIEETRMTLESSHVFWIRSLVIFVAALIVASTALAGLSLADVVNL